MKEKERDEFFIQQAIAEARQALAAGEVPIGAVVVCKDRIVGRGHNLVESLGDATAHAEMQAITAAANTLGGKYLNECTLYVTLEPCAMCAGACNWSQLGRVVWGAADAKRGFTTLAGAEKMLHPKTKISTGILDVQCAQLLGDFFKKLR